MIYKLGDVEYAAWNCLGIQEDRRPAFQARIKYLRKIGLLPTPGSRVRLRYSFEQVFEVICALLLQDADMLPAASIATAKLARRQLEKAAQGDTDHILLIGRRLFRFMPAEEAQALIGRDVLPTFLDLKLLADKVRASLEESVNRPKTKGPGRPRKIKSMADHVFGERDGE